MTSIESLEVAVEAALEIRSDFFEAMFSQNTDCYRLFHGTAEGSSGLTIDRYGEQILLQSFHEALTDDDQVLICKLLSLRFPDVTQFVYRDRSVNHSAVSNRQDQRLPNVRPASEGGALYKVKGNEKGNDPYLFLDFRAVRRYVRENASEKTVLNLFAYTCGVGIAAALGGARSVWNIDFAESSLEIGKQNAALNDIPEDVIKHIKSDFFLAVRQLAGLPIGGRKRITPVAKDRLDPQQFDLVVLDPPRWAKSRYGTVDLINDYQSVFKPALLATKEGGEVICCNNVAKVKVDAWVESLRRCSLKAGRDIRSIELIKPDMDFPTWDEAPPLKVAVLKV